MKRLDAIKVLNGIISKDTKVIYCNGRTARDGYYASKRKNNFYLLASMGHAASVAMGMSTKTDEFVVVADGDGNLLMNLNVLPAIGASNLNKFVHIVYDNKVYETTGNQETVLKDVKLDIIASSSGFQNVTKCETMQEYTDALHKAFNSRETSFIWVIIERNSEDPTSIIPFSPIEIKNGFMK